MAAQKSVPSDLYKCVYSFLRDNKFTKAAEQFLKQTKVVGGSCFSVLDNQDALSCLHAPRVEVVRGDRTRGEPIATL